MSGCRLIVNADDFGLSEKINEGIVKAHMEGIVTSTSIMANGAAFEHAVQLAGSTPTLDVGIHLTLTGEAPVLQRKDVSTLLDAGGHFYDHAISFTKRYFMRQISLDEIEMELDAQIRKVMDRNINVSHMDGHQHIHMLPGIRRIVGELADKYSIPAIRYPREAFSPYMLRETKAAGRLAQLAGLDAFCALAKTSGTVAPDRFFGFFFGGNLTRKNLLRVFGIIPASGTCELMCHPGMHDGHSQYSHWKYSWQDELDALTDQEIKNYLKTAGISLISYKDLATWK